MIKMIAAVSANGVIGIDNKLPFSYSEDMKHFKKLTMDSTVIMGRKTFESIGKSLPRRRNIVITSRKLEGVEMASSLEESIKLAQTNLNNVWLIGGAMVYQEGMRFSDEIHLTVTPDIINNQNSIKFPWINPLFYKIINITNLDDKNNLKYIIYGKNV